MKVIKHASDETEQIMTRPADFFEAVLSTIKDYVYSFDKEGRFLYANKVLLDLWGLTKEEVLGKTMADLEYPKEVETTLLGGVREVFATGQSVTSETFYTTLGGASGYYENVLSPMFAEDGSVAFVTGSSRDVTERKRTEALFRESSERMRLAMEATQMVTWEWNVPRDRITTSESFASVYGLPKLATSAEGFALVLSEDKDEHLVKVQRVASEGGSYLSQFRIKRADTGEMAWLEERGNAILDETGKVERLVGVTLDITERKLVEEQLRLANYRFKVAEDAANGFLYDYDPTTGAESRSDGFRKVLGYTHDDIPGGGALWEAIIHPDDVARVRAETEAAVVSGAPSTHYEYRIRHKNGGWLWVLDKNNIVRDTQGEPQHIIGSIVDISERKRSEEALRESMAQLRLVTDAMPALVSYIDSEYRYRLVNKAYTEWFGFASEDILGKTMSEVLGEAAFERLRPHVEAALRGKTETFETEVPYKVGGTRFIYAIYTPDQSGDTVKGFFVHVLDITERKRAEEALQHSEEKYRTLFTSMDEGYCIIEMMFDDTHKPYDWRFLEVNPAFEKHNGLTNATGKTIRELAPTIEEKWFEHYGNVAVTGEPLRFIEQSEALSRWFDLYAFRVGEPEERKVAVIFTNISERKRSEQALLESESRFRNMADHAPVMIWMTEPDGTCTFLSQSWYEFTGQTPETGLGFGWFEAAHPEDRAASEKIFVAANAKEEAFSLEYRLRHRDGSYSWAIDSAQPRFGEDGKFLGYIGSVLDISERKRAEEALHEANEQLRILNEGQKRFVADAAHELRAPLTAIQGNLQLMKQYDVDPEMQQEMLGDVRLESERLTRLVNDLLAIARGDSGLTLEKTPLPLNEVLLEAWRSATLLTSQHQMILGNLDRVEVIGNRDRLKQLVLILLENAVKYTPPSGRITLGLEHDAGFLRLCVQDTGIGIDKEDLAHVFERFYRADKARTRSADPTGTGLGLSIAEWIVAQHDGKIWLESEPGKGTTVWVELPLAS